MVYVLDRDGNPLMPTKRYGKVRHLLKDGKAVVVRRDPFMIRLTYDSRKHTQPVSLGVDAGSKHIGLSATTEKKELLSAQVDLRQDISKLLMSRRETRRSRRSRKTRYRKPRFQNRIHSKQKGWLAPSVQAKCDTHVKVVKDVCRILPVTTITIEMAPFDTQKLKADILGVKTPSGTDYQHGEAEDFDNIKAYVKWRDGYKCAVCGAEHVQLQVHHKKQRKDGGTDMPANLITVCADCHKAYHAGTLTGRKSEIMRPDTKIKTMRDASFMSIMRWAVWNRLKALGIPLHMTYGYETAEKRKQCDLPKDHRIDARCISGHPDVEPADEWFFCKKVRCHNRQIHKVKTLKGSIRKRNQAEHEIKGFRLFDKVKCNSTECFIFGRRSAGYMDVRTLDGTKVSAGISYKKLKFVNPAKHLLIERRCVSSHD
jgi:hypothetical protein